VVRSPKKLRRQLAFYALALAYAVAVIIGILLTVQDPKLTRATILSTIGLNVVSSVVFAVVFSTLGSGIQSRNLEESIDELFERHSDRLTKLITENNRTFYPSVQYPPSTDFDKLFNRDLTNSLEQSNNYFFRGPSPRYLPARIAAAKRGPSRVYVAMLDPRSSKALTRRAVDRQQRTGSRNKSIDELVTELRDELLMSVVALFDCRLKCPIQLIYTPDTSVTRSEILDDSIFISWYHGPSSPGANFPETLRFSVGTLIYETLKLDVSRQFEVSDTTAVFDSSCNDDELLKHLGQVCGQPVTREDIARWRASYSKFIQPFANTLRSLYENPRV
jgi:hypothetical protein